MAILATAMSMFAGTVTGVLAERDTVRESVIAAEGVQNFVERMRSEDIRTVWARYNADPSDDPDGAGTAPGPRFAIEGLDPGNSPDGMVAEVRFPDVWDRAPVAEAKSASSSDDDDDDEDNDEAASKSGAESESDAALVLQVREDLDDPRLGLPRDLNGDSIIDGEDHGDDYLLLPLEVVVRWRGRSGDRELRRFAMLCELKW